VIQREFLSTTERATGQNPVALSSPVASPNTADSRRRRQAAAGLVEQVTTLPTQSLGLAFGMRRLNAERRIRRMRRVVIEAADGARDSLTLGGGRYSAVLVTLTYAPGVEWKPEHIADYIQWVRKWSHVVRLKLRYQWVIELTKKGVPHYHVLFWAAGDNWKLPMADKCGAWPHGLSRVERARCAVGYLVKYATKGSFNEFPLPKGARLFGHGGGIGSEKLRAHRAGLPVWLLENLGEDSRGRRCTGVGWVDSETGEIFVSPFKLSWQRDEDGWITIIITKRGNAQCVS